MTVEAVYDRNGRSGWKYRLPRAGFVTPSVKRTSIVSSNAALIREVKELAFAVGVKLPDRWELLVRR
jgi:hypothetical protein